MKTTRTLACALVLTLLVPATAAAEFTRPVAVPDLDLPEGYDWASRKHATHIVVDATPLYSLVDALDVATPYLDLEITGLMPWRSYELSLGTIRRAVYTDGDGHGIAWNVFTESAMWVLTDTISSEPVTFITIRATPGIVEELTGPQLMCPSFPSPDSWRCVRSRPPAPQPISNATEEGFAVEQAAYSFTKSVAIKTSACYGRHVTIETKASGGFAGNSGTAGGRHSYSVEQCLGLPNQPGESWEALRANAMRKDVYEDGSWKVYSTGRRNHVKITPVEVYAEPGPDALRVDIEGVLTEPFTVLRLSERSAGSVYYEHGLKAFGTSLGVTFRAEGGGQTANTIEFEIQPPGMASFVLDWISGDYGSSAQRGIIGLAWKVA